MIFKIQHTLSERKLHKIYREKEGVYITEFYPKKTIEKTSATMTNAVNPRRKVEEKNEIKLIRIKQTNKCTRNTQTSSLFLKRGDHNAIKNKDARGQRAREDFKT